MYPITFCKFTGDTLDAAIKGAHIIAHGFDGLTHQEDVDLTPPFKVFDIMSFNHDRVASPLADNYEDPSTKDIDAYTLECEGLSYIGGVVIGDRAPLLRVSTAQPTFLADLLAASLYYLCQGDTNVAFAYIQSTSKTMALYMQRSIDVIGTKQNHTGRIKPYEL